MAIEHRIMKTSEGYYLQGQRTFFGLPFSRWFPYGYNDWYDIDDVPQSFTSINELIKRFKKDLRRGEVIPLIDTVTVD